MTAVSILLVDDHPVVREGYRRLLERQVGFRVSAEAEDAAAAYRAYQAERPDVVVMDLSLPGPGGLEAIRHIRQWDRTARLLVFTMHASAAFALKAFEAGACGYITKSSAPHELVRAIATVARGGRALAKTSRAKSPASGSATNGRWWKISGRVKRKSCDWWRQAGPRSRSRHRSI